MKKWFPVFILLIANACSTPSLVPGKEYVFKIPQSRLQAKMDETLPITKSYSIFKITLVNPRVTLKEGGDRIHVGLDVSLHVSFDHDLPSLNGSVDISGNIRYDNAQGAFYLVSPTVEKIGIAGIPDKRFDRVNAALSKILDAYYLRHPVYTLDTRNIKQAALKMVLKSVMVKNAELVVVLGI
jgi:hypothetical protein